MANDLRSVAVTLLLATKTAHSHTQYHISKENPPLPLVTIAVHRNARVSGKLVKEPCTLEQDQAMVSAPVNGAAFHLRSCQKLLLII